MDKKDPKNIDQFMKDNLEEREFELKEDYLKEFESSYLDKSGSTSIMGYALTALLCISILSAGYFYYQYQEENNKTPSQLVQEEFESETKKTAVSYQDKPTNEGKEHLNKAEIDSSFNEQTNAIINQEIHKEKESKKQEAIINSEQDSPAENPLFSEPRTEKQEKPVNNKKFSQVESLLVSESGTKKQNEPENNLHKAVVKGSFDDEAIQTLKIKKERTIKDSHTSVSDNQLNENSQGNLTDESILNKGNKNHKTPLPPNIDADLEAHQIEPLMPLYLEEKTMTLNHEADLAKPSYKPLFSIALYANESFVSKSISSASASTDYIEKRNNEEQSVQNHQAGLELTCHTNNFNISSGIHYLTLGEKTIYDPIIKITTLSQWEQQSHYQDTLISNNPGFDSSFFTLDSVWVVNHDTSRLNESNGSISNKNGNNKIQYVEIPFLIGKELAFRRWRLGVSAGASVGFFINAKGFYLNKDLTGLSDLNDNKDIFNSVLYNLLIDVNVKYVISNRWNVFFRYSLKSNMNSLFSSSYEIDQKYRLNSFGAGLELNLFK